MHNCAFCKNPLTPWYQWKGGDGRFYCNEFCADASEANGEFDWRREFHSRTQALDAKPTRSRQSL
jgi:hypothetical protein